MGFRLQKRINVGNGFGINVSKSGLSTSYRSRYGSISTKGYSLRTGIPGLTFKGSFGGKKGKNQQGGFLLFILLIGVFYLAALIIYNLFLLITYAYTKNKVEKLRKQRELEIKTEVEENKNSLTKKFTAFEKNMVEIIEKQPCFFYKSMVKDGAVVNKGDRIGVLKCQENLDFLTASSDGTVHFFYNDGEEIKLGDYLYKIEKT
jgi:biotin carboxyl carrier protein